MSSFQTVCQLTLKQVKTVEPGIKGIMIWGAFLDQACVEPVLTYHHHGTLSIPEILQGLTLLSDKEREMPS